MFGALGLHRHPGWNLFFLELLQLLLQLNELFFYPFNSNRGQVLRIIDGARLVTALMNLTLIVKLEVAKDSECLLCRDFIVNDIFSDSQWPVIRFPVQEGFLLALERQLTWLRFLYLLTVFIKNSLISIGQDSVIETTLIFFLLVRLVRQWLV